MFRYVIKRILLAFVTLFIILSLTFILMKTLPFQHPNVGDKNSLLAYYTNQAGLGYLIQSTEALTGYGDPVAVLATSSGTSLKFYFYQEPIMVQYVNWLKSIFTTFDWGRSTFVDFNVPVLTIIGRGLPYTIGVNIISVILAVPIGVLLGVWAALKKNKPTDHIISTLVMVLISVPSFVMISFLIMTLGYSWHLLPTSWPRSYDPIAMKVKGYIIPVIALSFGSICGYCRFTRAELCDVLSSDYLLLARTKGLTKGQSVIRHALRNAMVPILPSILAEIIGVISGSMILESLYDIPGIGTIYFDAISQRDYNLLMADMAVFTTIGLLSGIVLDLSYGFLDPRIRIGAKK